VSVSAASNVVSSVATLWYLMAFAAVAGAPATQLTLSQPAAANPREATH
jgi:hypothetical protein